MVPAGFLFSFLKLTSNTAVWCLFGVFKIYPRTSSSCCYIVPVFRDHGLYVV